MPLFNIFSKRFKKNNGEISDILTYDSIPESLRIQIIHIMNDAIGVGTGSEGRVEECFGEVHNILCREYGLFILGNRKYHTYHEQIYNFFLQTNLINEAIDVIELCFKFINTTMRVELDAGYFYSNVKLSPDDAIDELNERFKESAIGYSFDGNEIIRIDSTFAHSEITKPTINLINNRKFQGANEEYLKAHEHYRHGRNKECLNECLKSFESVLKIICKEKGWSFKQTDTAKKLIQICFEKDLVPTFTQNQFTSLQNLLESGVQLLEIN